jgi:hypothetical protein
MKGLVMAFVRFETRWHVSGRCVSNAGREAVCAGALLYSNQGHPTLTQYTQGTLNIDIIGVARKQLVWESVVTGSVTLKAR